MIDFRPSYDTSGGRASAPGRWIAFLLLAAATVMLPDPLQAHLALRQSAPAAEERLSIAPDAIRLFFTEPVERSLSSISLEGPGGSIRLGTLVREGAGEILSAALPDGIAPGEYRVVWQAVGRDGHPVRGEFTFAVEDGAAGAREIESRPPGVEGQVSEGSRSAVSAGADSRLTTRSPLFAAVRWLMYVGIVGTLGALGFAALLRSHRLDGVDAAYRSATERATAAFGIVALLPLALSIPLRLQAQSHVVFGAGVTRERFSALVGSSWGIAWTVQLAACILAILGLFTAWRGRAMGWGITAVAAVGLVVTPPLSGHSAAVEEMRWLAFGADALHIAGAGLWIGTLAALVLVGIPLVRLTTSTDRGRTLVHLVSGFSPVAMVAAAVLVSTGVISSIFQLTAPADLLTTAYGRLLSAKLLIVMLVLGLGAFNWRRLRPVMGEPGAGVRLRRTGGAEITAALIVIMLTAVLVAVQPPARSTGDALSAAPPSAND